MTKLIRVLAVALFTFFVSMLFAQERPETHHMDHKSPYQKSPYVSEDSNEIKALTNEELTQLQEGEGMGLAKAAELNGYPGPKHVLDLYSELKLSTEQKEKSLLLFKSMKTEAKQLGKLIIEKEKELDLIFKANASDEELIRNKVMEISQLRGKLRFVHLGAHIKQKKILTEQQVTTYIKLRGYN